MKIFHYLNFLFIFLVLVAICIAEDVVVSNSLKEVQSYCFQLEQTLSVNDDLKNMDIVLQVDNLESKWLKQESNLCYLVNHKNIQEMGQEISKLKSYIPSNDVDAFKVSVGLIKSYCKSYTHFMGANLHNIL